MMWIDDEPIEGDPNNAGRTATSDLFASTVQVQADAPYTDNPAPLPGGVLSFTDAIDQSIGGITTPGWLLGWSDGLRSVAQKWQKLTGLVIQPPRTANLTASMPYGQVGQDNRAQNLLLGTQYQAISDLLPSNAQINKSYTHG